MEARTTFQRPKMSVVRKS